MGLASLSGKLLVTLGILATALGLLVLVLPYAAGYGPYRRTLFYWLTNSWADPTWQHGALAFPIAGFLVWRQRMTLSQIPMTPSLMGLAVAVFALGLYWTGYRGNFYYLGYGGIHLLLAAAVWWIWGWRHLRTVAFAWFVAGFAWPYLFLEDTLAFKLRYLMVTTTSWLLNHAGIATLQDGTRLLSAAVHGRAQGQWFDLNIDGPCSGLRSLFALMMVGSLFGYFRQRSFWRRALIFGLSVPLALAANMVRILVLIVASMLFGQRFAIGDGEGYTSNFHFLAGIGVFLVAFGGLVLVEKGLNRWCGKQEPLSLSEEREC